jgi:hypothetical protein
MELKLEMIVETLLVGAMVSLFFLSIIFFLFGHIWHVPVMRRFFETLFGERGNPPAKPRPVDRPAEPGAANVPHPVPGDESSRATATGAHRSPREKSSSEGGAGFGRVLLLALLYGLGVIAESQSHHQHPGTEETKAESFKSVAEGRLKSGLASDRLKRLTADYDACEALSKQKGKQPSSLCAQIKDRVREFFYTAKNAVFQDREYHQELEALEARISFMRSFENLAWWLFWELAIVFVIAGIAELGHAKLDKPWTRLMQKLFSQSGNDPERTPTSWRDRWYDAALHLGDHWVKIAAFHILLLVGACGGLVAACRLATAYSDEQFAKRVFGYYLALPDVHEPGKKAGTLATDEEAVPESPYHVFSLAAPIERKEPQAPAPDHPRQPEGFERAGLTARESPAPIPEWQAQRRLEPSAVQILGESSQVLVASDQGGEQPFWLFTLDAKGTRLEDPRPVRSEKALNLANMGTIESLSAYESFKGDSCGVSKDHAVYHVFAGPSKLGSGTASLISFCLHVDPSNVSITGTEHQKVLSPCHDVLQSDSCEVEGIAFRSGGDGEQELLLGIQKAGQRSTVRIIRMRWDASARAWGKAEQILPSGDTKCSTDAALNAMLTSDAGISDLAAAPSGRIYVTTSIQRDDPSPASWTKEGRGPQVGGALWLVDLGCDARKTGDPCRCSAQKATQLETFIHKPDGVTHDNGSVLIVFDDEARRKSVQWAPVTFPLAQNEAVFAVLPSPEFK